jgi:hypothetical protein
MLMAVIALVGWSAMTTLNVAADLYPRRFCLDVEDNLLARKHVTQVRVILRAAYVLVVLITFGAALMTPIGLFAGVQLAMRQPIHR